MKNRKWLLAMMGVFTVLSAYGELPHPERMWWRKIGFNAYALYRSSDLIGEGQILRVEELPPGSFPVGDLKLTVVFTNMIKGDPGKYEVTMPEDLRWTRGYASMPTYWPAFIHELIRYPLGGLKMTVVFTNTMEGISASSLPYTNTTILYPPIALMIDTNGAFCGKPGQSYSLACTVRYDKGPLELHAILPPGVWATFSDQVTEGKRKHEEWVEAKRARQHEIQLIQLKLQDALELGDITQDEYDRQSAELEPLREEDRKIHIELWNDRAGYKYYNETFLEPME